MKDTEDGTVSGYFVDTYFAPYKGTVSGYFVDTYFAPCKGTASDTHKECLIVVADNGATDIKTRISFKTLESDVSFYYGTF